jgi:hypothetical protein
VVYQSSSLITPELTPIVPAAAVNTACHDTVAASATLHWAIMNPTQKTSFARGTRGFLLQSIDDAGCSRYFFRVYSAEHSFCDYELLHTDLEIEIVDDEATFYEADEGHEARLDHSPLTLGHEG